MIDGFLDLSLASQSKSQVVVCFRITGLDPQGLKIMMHGLFEKFLRGQCICQVVVRFSIVGFDP